MILKNVFLTSSPLFKNNHIFKACQPFALSLIVFFYTFCFLTIPNAQADGKIQSRTDSAIQSQAEKLKQDVIKLNRELFSLEESLLYPVNSQVGLFLSVGTHDTFQLDSVDIKIDGHTATTYIYTEKEVNALEQGGIQRLYMGNLASGPHKLNIIFNGKSADDHFFRREKLFKFKKDDQAKNIELKLVDSDFKKEPTIKMSMWR